MLRDPQEAEDAVQAAFLVLVRNAESIRKRPSLGAWLYGVAYRVAARLRGRSERRRMLLGARKDKGPGLTPEQHSEIRHSEDLQAHPYPQQPTEKALPEMNPGGSGCTS